MKIVSLTEDNFSQIDAQELLNPARYVEVENLVLAVGGEGYPQAVGLASILVNRLSLVAEKMPKELFAKYFFLLKVLKLFGIRTLSDKEKQDFFSESILDIFKSDVVSVYAQIDYIFKAYAYSPDILKGIRDSLVLGLDKNVEVLGEKNINVTINGEERIVNPTIQNWLADYNSHFHTSSQIKKRGGYEQINYITGSVNTRTLSKQDSNVLLKVLQFYDWIKFDPLTYNFREQGQPLWEEEIVNVEKPEKLISDELSSIVKNVRSDQSVGNIGTGVNYINSQRFELPGNLQQTETVIKPPLQAPVPKNAPQVVPMEEVSSSPAAVMPPLTVKKQGPVQGYVMGAKNSNIQDLLKSSAQDYESRGLRMGSNPSSLISDPLPKVQTNNPSSLNVNPLPGDAGIKKQNSKEQEINKKLEDLEKRIKK